MRHSSIAVIAVISTVAFVQIASAADLPRKAPPPPPPPPVYSWTGFYAGLNAGGTWGQWDISAFPNSIFANSGFPLSSAYINANQPSVDLSGFTGGGQVGYNRQIGNVVLGGEADINYFGLRGSLAFSANPIPGTAAPLAVTGNVSTDWLATIRGRLGYAFNRWLVYATGGLAVSELKFSETVNIASAGGTPGSFVASASSTNWGWTVGGGVEWAFSGPWTAKVEYLYLNLGDLDTIAPITGPLAVGREGSAISFQTSLRSNIVRAGVNYRF
jgi:outer membrane immunogenic protein